MSSASLRREQSPVDHKLVPAGLLQDSILTLKHDISSFCARRLTDKDKEVLLNDCWIPPVSYTFQIIPDGTGKMGNMEQQCSEKLGFVIARSKVYFVNVALDLLHLPSETNFGQTVTQLFVNFKDAIRMFTDHNREGYHKTAKS